MERCLVNSLVSSFPGAILIGLGATLTLDLWSLFLKRAFKIAPSNMCLVGRWIQYMPQGVIRHSNLALAPPKKAECPVGWIVHYMTGILFAITFIVFIGRHWLQHPTPAPAMIFGILTVSAPFFIMQPCFGLGVAASKSPNPSQSRLRGLMSHIVFGIGLYLFGLLISWMRC
jgi:hypothetical protein